MISNFYSSDVLGQFFNLSPPWVSLNPTYRVCKLVNKNIFWDEMLLGYQDIDFHISVILKKLKFGYLNGKPDCLWRKHKQGNVAHVLNKGDNQFNQLLYIFNKYRKIEEVDKQQIAPLVARLFNQFIYAKISLRKVFISIRIFASENEKYYLLKFLIYFVLRISIRYKIPLVPKYCRKVLYKLGDGYIFNVLPKTHYLINKVNFNKIIIEPSI